MKQLKLTLQKKNNCWRIVQETISKHFVMLIDESSWLNDVLKDPIKRVYCLRFAEENRLPQPDNLN